MKPLSTCLFFLTLTSLILTSCMTIDSRGQYVSDDVISKLEHKNLNKTQVEELVGSPTMVSEYSPNIWYYLQRSLSKKAWFAPKVTEQRILKITFENNNKIASVEVLNNTQQEKIHLAKEFTKTPGTEMNGIQKFVRNIGRFNSFGDSKKHQRKQ